MAVESSSGVVDIGEGQSDVDEDTKEDLSHAVPQRNTEVLVGDETVRDTKGGEGGEGEGDEETGGEDDGKGEEEDVVPYGEFPLTPMATLTMQNGFTASYEVSEEGESWRFPFRMKHLGMDDDTSLFCGKLAQMEENLGRIYLSVESQGFVDKKRGRTLYGRSRAYIRVNGKDYSRHRRGFNVVVLNYKSGRIEARRSFDTHGSRYAAKKFKQFISRIRRGRIVLLAIQDEAYRFGRYYKYVLKRLHINPRSIRLSYRSSLALIGYVGRRRPYWVRYMSRPQPRGPSYEVEDAEFDSDEEDGSFEARDAGDFSSIASQGILRVRVESQGYVDKKRGRTLHGRSRAYIRVNGRDYSLHRRGFNIVLVSHKTGRVLKRGYFDTHASRYQAKRFKKFIYSIRRRTIVLLAIQDEAYRFGKYYKYVLRRLNIDPRRIILSYRSSLALIGFVGRRRPYWLKYMSRPQKRGPSYAVSHIPLRQGENDAESEKGGEDDEDAEEDAEEDAVDEGMGEEGDQREEAGDAPAFVEDGERGGGFDNVEDGEEEGDEGKEGESEESLKDREDRKGDCEGEGDGGLGDDDVEGEDEEGEEEDADGSSGDMEGDDRDVVDAAEEDDEEGGVDEAEEDDEDDEESEGDTSATVEYDARKEIHPLPWNTTQEEALESSGRVDMVEKGGFALGVEDAEKEDDEDDEEDEGSQEEGGGAGDVEGVEGDDE
ncbi:hypothetical protein AWC38_SpisGene3581 [Stylophora pistillata]|uniref:ILEI/PANDER domain-containing protein n=1 Tax=Stylophora pistillata TaxID=50429 RepID=A0A2B4SQX6_STYPI|nr:hypothetical protein AWC38_SpisGene3581 [Stylophora pistillata]